MSDPAGAPAQDARLQRFQASQVHTSLLGVAPALSIGVVGFEPVGEVMGCIVQQMGWQGYGGCGMWMGPGWGGMYGPSTTVASRSSRFGGYGPYVDALTRGYDTALGRMVGEAKALGADGVVGVRLTVDRLQNQTQEFVALGTAVRANSRRHPPTPFTTELPGTDVAKLMLAGWTPVAMRIGLEVAIRHDDYQTRMQAGSRLFNTANVEVTGYTELVQHSRGFARDRLLQHIRKLGADGVVVSDMRLRIWEIEPGEGHIDHVAEASITGTAIARFRRSARPASSTLTMLPLRNRGANP